MSRRKEASRILGELLDRGIQISRRGADLAFRAPRGAWDTALQGQVVDQKPTLRALLDDLTKAAPATCGQERLWLLGRGNPQDAAYNMPDAWRLRGWLDVGRLEAALLRICERHESLRTHFREIAGRPCQVVSVSGPPLHLIDLRRLAPARREVEARRRIADEARRPFAFDRGSLFRAAVLCLDGPPLRPRDSIFFKNVHHTVFDGLSEPIFCDELARLFVDLDCRLPELKLQLADVAAQQRHLLRSARRDKLASFWKKELAGKPRPTLLPRDRPRRTGGRALFERKFSGELARSLYRLHREAGSSLFMVTLTAFTVLLSRVSGEREVVLGTTSAGRERIELEGLIGFFVHTLLIVVKTEGDPLFRDFLRTVQEKALEVFAHQEMPLEALSDQREKSSIPSPHILFQLHMGGGPALHLADLETAPFEIPPLPAKFDLVVNLRELPQKNVVSTWHYRPELLDATSIARLAEQFTLLLAAAGRSPHRLSELPLLSRAAAHQIRTEWNDGEFAERKICLHELFRWRVREGRERTAVRFWQRHLSYGGLQHRADRLARRLEAAGARRGNRIALLLDREPEAIIAIIGTLSTGAVYVPLDPASPPERLGLVLRDTGALTTVSRKSLLDRLPEGTLRQVILLDENPLDADLRSTPRPPVTPQDPAYVIYTSGSTGAPKGVIVSHANVVRLFAATRDFFFFQPSDVFSLFHSYAFDFSVWEIWGALLHGATLVIVPFATSRNPSTFAELIRRERVSVLSQTPSAFRLLLRADRADGSHSLRLILFGGETLNPADLRSWIEHYGDEQPRLVNMYGITETTVHVTRRRLRRGDTRGSVNGKPGSVIGRPIYGWRLHLLDRLARPVPVGVMGEIAVAGGGVAQGYLKLPYLTAERFVPDPWGSPGERLYLSGDQARRLADGELEYLGRLDAQVQVRGFRVEPGEIEAHLTRHPAIHEAAVLLHQDPNGDDVLTAFVTGGRGYEKRVPGLGELRNFLASHLPEYMLPSALIPLSSLPLNVHGKIDREVLFRCEIRQDTATVSPSAAPETELERYLSEQWGRILGIPEVGREDDFFELGGDSIQGAILINHLQQELGEILHVVTIFDCPNVAAMARYLTAEYPEAVARAGWTTQDEPRELDSKAPLSEADVLRFRRGIPPLPSRPAARAKNPAAIFILAPPRSGTTLLRVMLGGHPRLFAPPELELLSFNTLSERSDTFSGRFSFWSEGTVRALMAIFDLGAQAAQERLRDWENDGTTTHELYALLQDRLWRERRILVDKTPSYAVDPATLERAEQDFEDARYLHLVRHPEVVVSSFIQAKLDTLLVRQPPGFDRRQLAELHWLVSHRNILRFLKSVPRDRQHRVYFEELVDDPRASIEEICRFLDLDFHPEMIEPYRDPAARMSDGVHVESRMLGDVKFHQHKAIDPETARGQRQPLERPLSELSWALAGKLGYLRSTGALTPIAPREGRRPPHPPLSFAQQRLFFLHQIAPRAAAYNMPAAFDLEGRIDVRWLGTVFQAIVQRHETLRTCFPSLSGQPFQQIAPRARCRLPVVDLEALPSARRTEIASMVVHREALRSFDLASGPLFRFALIRLEENYHRLFLHLHHIIADGWSLGVLYREITSLWSARIDGSSLTLPRLPIQYADYALWQREWLAGDALETAAAYWRRQLRGLTTLELPLDRPRAEAWSEAGSSFDFDLPSEETAALAKKAAAAGVSLYILLLSAFLVLLHRLASSSDVAVGSPIAHRNRREIEDLIGFFVNTLVLRLHPIRSTMRLGEAIAKVRNTVLQALAHQDMPFEKLVEELAPERDPGRHPLFQVAFAMANAPSSKLDLRGLHVRTFEIEIRAARLDLELFMSKRVDSFGHDRLGGSFVYSTALFDPSTLARIATSFQHLLRAVADGDPRLGELPLLSPAAKHQALVEWNDTAEPMGRWSPVEADVSRLAAELPDRIALSFDDRRMSYRELERQADRLAGRLSFLGVTPEVFVGIFLERSIELIVALLGVLKVGGAFVLLDREQPRRRLAFFIRDARIAVLVTARYLAPTLPPSEAKTCFLDRWRKEKTRPFKTSAHGWHCAYLIYTSGSTGRPKGVVVSRRGLKSHLAWMRRAYPLNGRDAVVHKTPVSFDVAVWEIFWALSCGARLEVARPGGHRDPQYLAKLTGTRNITVLHFVPSLLPFFLDENHAAQDHALRIVVCGGEALPVEIARRFSALLPHAHLYNFYGPCETTIGVTAWRCDPSAKGARISLGRPVARVRLYVLDRRLTPIPPGGIGEIAACGEQLSRGYLQSPGLTAARFLPDPFGPAPGERLYKTGDRGRFRPDGTLSFRGRADRQIKLQGVRIETGEIEAVLLRHEAVQEAAVAHLGGSKLSAYVAPRRHLRASWSERRVSEWRHVYDTLHSPSPDPKDGDLHEFTGWTSSYTGRAIPAEEMREWLDQTVERILELRPLDVLEIGCGNGLLLERILPFCRSYLGADISSNALDLLRRKLDPRKKIEPANRPAVTLLDREADKTGDLDAESFDTVILNSVVQYFPDADYLTRTLEGAVHTARHGGRIFVGDVRSLPLHELFATSVELANAEPSLSLEELRQRIRQRLRREEELLVDPYFFYSLAERLPRIGQIRIRPKGGRFRNELNRFRYDVLLHLDVATASEAPVRLDWRGSELTLAALREQLSDETPPSLAIHGVPSRPLERDVLAEKLLGEARSSATVEELRATLATAPESSVEPRDFAAAVHHLPYAFELSWAAGRKDGNFDALFYRTDRADPCPPGNPPAARPQPHTNDPLSGKLARHLEPLLSEYLRRRLPEVMVPAHLVVKTSLPHLSSGKIDRAALEAEGRTEIRGRSPLSSTTGFTLPQTPHERALGRIWSELLDLDQVGVEDPFFRLGGDSILAIRVVARARELGYDLSLRDLFRHHTLRALAELVEGREHGSRRPPPDSEIAVSSEVAGLIPLTPIQRWFFHQNMAEPWHFNQSALLRSLPIDPAILRKALAFLLRHHDMLRARFTKSAQGWQQWISPAGKRAPFLDVDLGGIGQKTRRRAVRQATTSLHRSLDLSEGPLVRLAYFRPGRIFLVIHHLVVDRVSWPVLLGDLERLCRQLSQGERPDLGEKSTAFQDWASTLHRHARSEGVRKDLATWEDILAEENESLPVDHDGPNTKGSVDTVSSVLDAGETHHLLRKLTAAYGTGAVDPLLVALVFTLAAWTGRRCLLVELEGHGREETRPGLELSRTVGWFTSAFPVFLDLEGIDDYGVALTVVRDLMRRLPQRGLSYGLLRYLSPHHEAVESLGKRPAPELLFNYLGHIEDASTGLFEFVEEEEGPNVSPRLERHRLLELNAYVLEGRLRVDWHYSRNRHRRSTLKALAESFVTEARRLLKRSLPRAPEDSRGLFARGD